MASPRSLLFDPSLGHVVYATGSGLSINLSNNGFELFNGLLAYSEQEGIGFIPWFPVATGELARAGGPLDRVATEHGATPAQLALAWLLHRSPVVLPIPGTSSVAHLEENVAAAAIRLAPDELAALESAV